MDAFLIALPKLLFFGLSALPLVLGTIAAIRHLRAGSRLGFLQNIAAGMAAGAVALALLWSSMFGDSLSKSSTAALIFAVAPMYAAVAQGLVYAVVAAIFRKSTTPKPIPLLVRGALLVPMLMVAVLVFGLAKISFEGMEPALAQRVSDTKTLHRLLEKSRTGDPDAFGIALHLAQNPDAPTDMLRELARHDHPVIRGNVAHNPRTPQAVVAALRYDCASFVRKAVVERLGPDNALQPAPAPTGMCALERWR